MPTMRAISRMDFPLADNSCMVLMVPLLIIATSLVSKINTRVALLKGWVNSFLAFMGQLYLGFYRGGWSLMHMISNLVDYFCKCSILSGGRDNEACPRQGSNTHDLNGFEMKSQ